MITGHSLLRLMKALVAALCLGRLVSCSTLYTAAHMVCTLAPAAALDTTNTNREEVSQVTRCEARCTAPVTSTTRLLPQVSEAAPVKQ